MGEIHGTTSSGGGGAPSGAAGGSLAGTYPNPGVSADAAGASLGPGSHGWKAWTFDPILSNANTAVLTAGTIYVVRLYVPFTTTFASVAVSKASAGTTMTNTFIGVYDSTGARLAVTSDVVADFNAGTGYQAENFTSATASVNAGSYVDVAILFVGGTVGTLIRMNPTTAGSTGYNITSPGSSVITATGGTAQSTLPASGLTKTQSNATYFWAALL